MIFLWEKIFYEPLYNALVFLISVIPGGDVGLAVIILTILVKLLLFPLSQKSIKSQAKLKNLEPQINQIKEKYKKDKETQAKKVLEFYKTNKVNPFSGCLLILIQLPIIIGLYWVFLQGLDFQEGIIYSFVSFPDKIDSMFLGLIDMHGKSLLLAFLAGVSQYFQLNLAAAKMSLGQTGDSNDIKGQMAKMMGKQMKYVLPIVIFIVSYQLSAAVALYWAISNSFAVGQELYVKHQAKRDEATRIETEQNNQLNAN